MRLTALQWAVVVLCFAVNALDGFDIQAIAFTAPAIRETWTLSGRTLGVVFSAGLVGMAVGSILLGALSDRIGRRRTILLCVALFGAATLLTGSARNVPELIGLRFLTGLGIGGVLPSLNTLVAEYAPERRRNLLVAVMHLGYPLGAMVGGLIAAQIIPEHGWRWVFYGGGLATLALWPLLAAALPESPQYLLGRADARSRARGLALLERIGHRAEEVPAATGTRTDREPGILSRESGMRTHTLALWSGFFLGYLALYFLMSWIPTLLVDAGLALDRSIYAGIALNIGGGIGMLALGYWSATRGLRPLIMGFFAAAALSMVVLGQLPLEIALLLPVTVICGFFALGALIGLYSVAARIYPASARASGVGWAIGAGRVGGILGPVIGGVLVELHWPTGWYFTLAAVPLLLATGAMAAIRARELAPEG